MKTYLRGFRPFLQGAGIQLAAARSGPAVFDGRLRAPASFCGEARELDGSPGEGDPLDSQVHEPGEQFANIGPDGAFIGKLQSFHGDQAGRELGRSGRRDRAVVNRLA